MSINFAISQILISSLLGIVTCVWGIFRYRRKERHRRGAAKLQAYLLWGLSGLIAISNIVPLAYLYTEYLWFESVGYVDVFWRLHQTRWGIFGIFFLVALAFMNANARYRQSPLSRIARVSAMDAHPHCLFPLDCFLPHLFRSGAISCADVAVRRCRYPLPESSSGGNA